MQTDDLKAAHDHLYNEKLAVEKSNKNLQISAAEVGKKLSDGHLQLQDADSFNKKSANENGKNSILLFVPVILCSTEHFTPQQILLPGALEFSFSEKATKICAIFLMVLTFK